MSVVINLSVDQLRALTADAAVGTKLVIKDSCTERAITGVRYETRRELYQPESGAPKERTINELVIELQNNSNYGKEI
jgi:hypothetical protein